MSWEGGLADITLLNSISLARNARWWCVGRAVKGTVVFSVLLLILISSVQVAFADGEAVREVEYPETVSPGEEFDIVNTIEYDLDELTLFSEEIFLAEDVPEGEPVPITAAPLSERTFNLYGKGTVKVTHTLKAPDYETTLQLVETLWFHDGVEWIEIIPERAYLEIKVQEPVPQILGVPILHLLAGVVVVTLVAGLLFGFRLPISFDWTQLLGPEGRAKPKRFDNGTEFEKWKKKGKLECEYKGIRLDTSDIRYTPILKGKWFSRASDNWEAWGKGNWVMDYAWGGRVAQGISPVPEFVKFQFSRARSPSPGEQRWNIRQLHRFHWKRRVKASIGTLKVYTCNGLTVEVKDTKRYETKPFMQYSTTESWTPWAPDFFGSKAEELYQREKKIPPLSYIQWRMKMRQIGLGQLDPTGISRPTAIQQAIEEGTATIDVSKLREKIMGKGWKKHKVQTPEDMARIAVKDNNLISKNGNIYHEK